MSKIDKAAGTPSAADPSWPLIILGLVVCWALAAALVPAWVVGAFSGTRTLSVGGWGKAALTVWWRGPERAFTPGISAWLYWPMVALVWAGPVLGGLWGWLRFTPAPTGGAQWGGARVERKLKARNDPARRVNRISAGRGLATGKVLAGKKNISGIAFGPPGWGKTTGLLLPNLAEWAGPAVMTTAKAGDLEAIYGVRSGDGKRPVWVIAPAGIAGELADCWSPIDYCTNPDAADRMAGWLADASSSGNDKRAAAWVDQAKAVVKGVLLAANLSGGGINSFRRWLQLGKDAADEVVTVLRNAGHDDVAEDYLGPWTRLHDDGVGSIAFTCNVIAKVYADEQVRRSSARTDIDLEEFFAKNGTVCLVASPSDAPRFAPLLTAITASIIHAAEMRYTATGRPLDPALGLALDEAGNMFRYPRLPNLLTTGRGMGIVALTIWHDWSQLVELLGREQAGTVLSASGMRILLPGLADLETLRTFSALYGRTEVERVTTTRSQGSISISTALQEADLAPVHKLQQMPEGECILQDGNLPPVKARLRFTFKDKDLKELLGEPVAFKDRIKPAPRMVAVPMDKVAA